MNSDQIEATRTLIEFTRANAEWQGSEEGRPNTEDEGPRALGAADTLEAYLDQ